MDLETFAKAIHERRNLFERDVKDIAENITLRDVLERVRFSPKDFYISHMDFERGQPIKSDLMCNTFQFKICLDEASLIGPYDLRVKSFKGLEVSRTYDEWCAGIQKAEDEYEPAF